MHNLAAVRAFYLDIAQWAMEDPARWVPWAAPCPIRVEDLARQKEIRARKSRMDQRTRERLPLLPTLLSQVNDMRTMTAVRLATAQATATASTARIWAQDPDTGNRRDLTGEEDRAFWTWAAVETLRVKGHEHLHLAISEDFPMAMDRCSYRSAVRSIDKMRIRIIVDMIR